VRSEEFPDTKTRSVGIPAYEKIRLLQNDTCRGTSVLTLHYLPNNLFEVQP